MKRTIILSLLGFITAVGSMAQEKFLEGDFRYVPTSASTVSVDSCCLGEGALAIIPEKVLGYTVTAIAPHAFQQSKVAAVYMPNTVISIGEQAFYQCCATFIKLSPHATAIGEQAFYNCPALGHIDLPEGLERIEGSTFFNTPIYTIGESQLPHLYYVGGSALANTGLQHFPLSDAVTFLGSGAFSSCKRLQDIHLPAGLTEVPDNLLSYCSSMKKVELPAGITRIGDFAFTGSAIDAIDLSTYQGSIGIMAFNECMNLPRITLPKNNPHCYTTEDGKALYNGQTRELISVLPTVERLVIPYPATGRFDLSTKEIYQNPETGETEEYVIQQYYSPLSGQFDNLEELELPHSWLDNVGSYLAPALKTLTMRLPTDFMTGYQGPKEYSSSCEYYVFNYVLEALSNNSTWRNRNLKTIERPTEQLYIAEVLPMYDNIRLVEEGQATLWDVDWNVAIEEAYPQYFTAGTVVASKVDYKTLFRDYMSELYMVPDKFKAFETENDDVLQCIDGRLRFAKGFDVNNYTNWFLHTNFIPATNYIPFTNSMSPEYTTNQSGPITQCNHFTTAPEWGMPVSEYGLFSRESGDPTATFALHMVPGVAYNIYAIIPPSHPESTEEQAYKNRLRPYLNYISGINEETGVAQKKTLSYSGNSGYVDVLYETGKVDSLLLFENVEVISDVYNLLTIPSKTTASLRKQGYSTNFPLIGILCEPQSELEVYPDAVQGVKQETTTVVSRYDISGRRITNLQRGINILRMSDGSTRKMMVR